MSENIFPELQHLLELPLTKATRLGHVQFFHFGVAQVVNASGLVLDVGAWTLAVACHWQLEGEGNVKISFEDVETPRDSQVLADPTFDPAVPGSNLRDRKLQELVRDQKDQLHVWQVSASPEGELALLLEGKQRLRIRPSLGVLPDTTYFWRLFRNAEPAQSVAFGPEGVVRA